MDCATSFHSNATRIDQKPLLWVLEYFLDQHDIPAPLLQQLYASLHELADRSATIQIRLMLRSLEADASSINPDTIGFLEQLCSLGGGEEEEAWDLGPLATFLAPPAGLHLKVWPAARPHCNAG